MILVASSEDLEVDDLDCDLVLALELGLEPPLEPGLESRTGFRLREFSRVVLDRSL